MNDEEFKRLHIKFHREHPEAVYPKGYWNVIPPERDQSRWLMSVLPPPPLDGKDVLDLAGGYGMYGAYLKNVRKYKFNYTCLDIRWAGPEYFKAFNLNPENHVYGDLRKPLTFPSERFDIVWMIGWTRALYGFPPEKIFREIHRVLKPQGHFYFDMAKPNPPLSPSGQHYTSRTLEELKELLKRTKFTARRIDSMHHTLIVLPKWKGVDFWMVEAKVSV